MIAGRRGQAASALHSLAMRTIAIICVLASLVAAARRAQAADQVGFLQQSSGKCEYPVLSLDMCARAAVALSEYTRFDYDRGKCSGAPNDVCSSLSNWKATPEVWFAPAAADDSLDAASAKPSGCYASSAGAFVFNALATNTGSCSTSATCVCLEPSHARVPVTFWDQRKFVQTKTRTHAVFNNKEWNEATSPEMGDKTTGGQDLITRRVYLENPDVERCARLVNEGTETWSSCMQGTCGTTNGLCVGQVNATLSADGDVRLAAGHRVLHAYSDDTFRRWFHEVRPWSKRVAGELVFTQDNATKIWTYDTRHFFPLDGQGWVADGDEQPLRACEATSGPDAGQSLPSNKCKSPHCNPDKCPLHNFHFTMRIDLTVKFKGDEVFKFTGDDDVWSVAFVTVSIAGVAKLLAKP